MNLIEKFEKTISETERLIEESEQITLKFRKVYKSKFIRQIPCYKLKSKQKVLV